MTTMKHPSRIHCQDHTPLLSSYDYKCTILNVDGGSKCPSLLWHCWMA